MNEWAEYANMLAAERRKEKIEMWEEVEEIRAKFGFKIENFAEEPTDFDLKLLHCFGIKWEGDER